MARALELVLAGGKYLPPEVLVASGARAPMTAQAPASLESLGLTERQLAVLRLLAKGASNKSICRELGLAERTVKAHVTAIMRSLKVSSRTQAAVEAVRLGVVDGSR
jgi:DNA-binding NarL/FixJ family response regulator